MVTVLNLPMNPMQGNCRRVGQNKLFSRVIVSLDGSAIDDRFGLPVTCSTVRPVDGWIRCSVVKASAALLISIEQVKKWSNVQIITTLPYERHTFAISASFLVMIAIELCIPLL